MMFHLEPNRELRNAERLIDGASSDPLGQDALPLDVRYLICVHRQASPTAPSRASAGKIMRPIATSEDDQ